MKNNKPIYIYIASCLSMLVPAPARLAYGLILILEVNFITFFSILSQSLIRNLRVDEFSKPLNFAFLFLFVLLYQQILNLYSPIISFTLGFNIYLTALAAIPSVFFTSDYIFSQNLSRRIKYSFKHCYLFSILALFFYVIRDLFAFGTLTFPGRFGIIEFKLIPVLYNFNSFFFNSILFALILLALFLAFVSLINRKFEIIRRAM
ncbi:MAG: hypothetical protein GX220_05330 [Treponema sp.]|nr:hypothetical protein [Treponema sp.]